MRQFLSVQLLPFKALRIAGPLIIAYLISLGTALYYCVVKFEPIARVYINKAFDDFQFPNAVFFPSLIILRSLAIFLLLPIALVAVVLPLKFIWISGKLNLGDLISETLPAIQRALAALYLSLWRVASSLVPACAMMVIYFLSIKGAASKDTQNLFFFAALCVTLWSVWRIMPLAAPVFIAIGGKLDAQQALQLAQSISKRRASELFFWQIAALVFPLVLCLAWNHANLNWRTFNLLAIRTFSNYQQFSLATLSAWQLAIIALVVWFCIAQMAFAAFRAVADLAHTPQH